MSRLSRYSLDWAGDIIQSPHGDWVNIRDVERLQDDLEASQKAKAVLMARLAELEAAPPVEIPEFIAGGRLFGWVNPNDARRFNSGKTAYCKVFKRRTDAFTMPLSNVLGPNHYQKPPAGSRVKIRDGLVCEVVKHVSEGLTVKAGGIEFNVNKWSWSPNGYSDERGADNAKTDD